MAYYWLRRPSIPQRRAGFCVQREVGEVEDYESKTIEGWEPRGRSRASLSEYGAIPYLRLEGEGRGSLEKYRTVGGSVVCIKLDESKYF